jgi:integrase
MLDAGKISGGVPGGLVHHEEICMASVRLRADNSIWLARFVDVEGRKREVSTGTTHRREAQKIADAYEAAAQRKFTAAHVQRTLREFFKQWIERRAIENARSTVEYYQKCALQFQRWASVHLPDQSRTQLALVQPAHIDAFRTHLLELVSVATVNHTMKFLRQIFDAARREGMLLESPCAMMKPIRRHEAAEVRPFTLEEVKRLLAVAGDEWRSLILFGLYTGQRLGDIARLDWKNVNLERGEVSFLMRKTGRRMIIPLAIPLLTRLASCPLLERLGPLHPRAAAIVARREKTHQLSVEFHNLMARCGLVERRSHAKKAEPRPQMARRRRGEISFHSFRHTATSLLRDAGAPQGVAMELIGHSSATVHQHYAHLGSDTLRRAVSLLPSL